MNKIKRSKKLLKAAFAVLLTERKLLVFPLVTAGLATAAMLFFVAPIALYPTRHPYLSTAHWQALASLATQAAEPANNHSGVPLHGRAISPFGNPRVLAFFAAVYFCSMVLATFCNVAFYHEILQALNGGRVSVRRGYRFAAARWQAVLLWSLFAGLVGYLINQIEQRVGFLGKIIMSFVGMAWSVACIFIIPALVRDTETSNPVRLLRDSAGTLKRTWGELIVGFVGLEFAFGVVFMVLFAAVIAAAVVLGLCLHTLVGLHAAWVVSILFSLAGLLAIAVPLSWLSSVVNPVYRCALYLYATEGVVPGTFDKELLDSAWKVK